MLVALYILRILLASYDLKANEMEVRLLWILLVKDPGDLRKDAGLSLYANKSPR